MTLIKSHLCFFTEQLRFPPRLPAQSMVMPVSGELSRMEGGGWEAERSLGVVRAREG